MPSADPAKAPRRAWKYRAASSMAPPKRGPMVSRPETRQDTRSLPARDVTIVLCAPVPAPRGASADARAGAERHARWRPQVACAHACALFACCLPRKHTAALHERLAE